MKYFLKVLTAFALIIFITSCGINSTFISNSNLNSTQVQLTQNNYKVVDKVTGNADVSYVLIFGGLNKKQLFENAYSAMINKANLATGSRAIINVLTEEHIGGYPPFYYTRTITVSGSVIEFTR